MGQVLQEIARVLRPGGLAWLNEPVYAGSFNDLMRLIHDEKRVRDQAFQTILACVESGALELCAEHFINILETYPD